MRCGSGSVECVDISGTLSSLPQALVATELQCSPVTLADGRTAEPSQCSSAYIFPGIGMGTLISGCTKLRDEQFIAAAEAVARMVTPDDLNRGAIYPPMSAVREVAALVAQAVALKAYQVRRSPLLPCLRSLLLSPRFGYTLLLPTAAHFGYTLPGPVPPCLDSPDTEPLLLCVYQGGHATALPKPHNLLGTIKNQMYNPQYRLYR